jgi:protein-tyrosine phosphatase
MSRLHWIAVSGAGRLAIMARPRAGEWLEIEVDQWKAAGIDLVVSLLEAEEVSELGLGREAELCRERGIAFLSFPVPDRGVPEMPVAHRIADSIARDVTGGRSVAIHCRAGIGRSSVIAACALVCAGMTAGEAFNLIKDARGVNVPDTDEQRDWVGSFWNARRNASSGR